MFPPMAVGGEEFVLRPANCPHHALVYAAEQRSFRDLPVRLTEMASMFRSELSGVLGGLSRVRQINLDDTHVFCMPEQVTDEIALGIEAAQRYHRILGIEVTRYQLSRHGKNGAYLGGEALWRDAERRLAEAMDRLGLAYDDAPGEAAFYGPKIDVVDVFRPPAESVSVARQAIATGARVLWFQPGTETAEAVRIATDAGLTVVTGWCMGSIHAQLGLGPAPGRTQVLVLPVSEQQAGLAQSVTGRIRAAGLRGECDPAGATLGARIRRARERRVPYLAVIGDREAASEAVALRLRDGRQLPGIPVTDVLTQIAAQVAARSAALGFGRGEKE